MISETDILLLHEFSIRDFGGAKEIRDRDLLSSAIARPFQTFDGTELYATSFEKAAALGESLIINHPFVDGNKRTAFLGMLALLYEYGTELTASEIEAFEFVVEMATGYNRFTDIVIWLENNTG